MRILPPLTLMAILLVGCLGPVNVAWRGVILHTENRASTEGVINNSPAGNGGAVEAPKTNDFKTDLNGGKTQ